MKRLLLVNSLALALFGTAVASAHALTDKINAPEHKASQCHHHVAKILTPKQRTELQQTRKDMHAQLLPLIKEKRALQLQITGKMATANVQWSEIASLVDKSSAIHAKIARLVAKTRFETYQKSGIMLPLRHHKHCHNFKNFAHNINR